MTLSRWTIAALLALLPVPADAQDDLGRCIELQGSTADALLHNRCNQDLNVAACCSDDGDLPSCHHDRQSHLLLPANATLSVGACNNYVFWSACAPPLVPTDDIDWDFGVLYHRGEACVDADDKG